MFDLDLGLVRYAPLTVLLFLAVTLIALRAREGGDAGLVAVLALMMVVSSATGNWNHGTTGPSRYVVWLFPLIASVLLLGPTASALLAAPRRAYPALVALAVAAQAAMAAARGGVAAPLDYLEHSAMARFVLDRWPGQYAPLPEVFRERTAHTEADLDEPVVYRRDGRCRKALARWRDSEALRARCGTLPEPARAFFAAHPPKEDRTRWIYVDY